LKKQVTVDLHGLTENEAYLKLLETMNNLPPNIDRVIVIHGYHGGNILKNLVREQFTHYKILEKGLSLNEGETIFYIDPKKR